MEKVKEKTEISWLMEFAGKKKVHYAVSVILAILGVACSIMPYIFMGNIVKNLLEGVRDFSVYLKICLWMGVFWILRVLFHELSTSFSHVGTFQVLGNMRKSVCDKLAKLPLGSILDMPSGSLKNIIVERIDSIETTLAHIVPEFTSNLLAPVVIFIYMLTIDWRMALIALITLPIALVCFMGMMVGYEESFSNTVKKTKILNDTAVEYINGIEVIKVFGKAKSSYEKFAVAAKEGASCYIDWMRRCNLFFCLAMAIAPATLVTVLPFGGWFVKNGSLSAGDFAVLIFLSMSLITPLITVASYMDDLGKLKTVLGEVTDILEKEELQRPEKTKDAVTDYSIAVRDVRFAYKEQEVLHGVNMDIPEGKVTAFVGPSGSGKSTIAKLIASLWDVGSGSIQIGRVDIRDISLEEYNRMVAYVSQDNFLFDETIRENIRKGRLDATDAEVEEVARLSGCHDFISKLENGYDTVVGDAGGHLSGGERQRIAIARAMLKDAPIVILDEATAYTDPENEAVIQSSVAKLVKGKTLIVIAHRLSTIADSDQIYVIKDGCVDSKGTHTELLAQGGLYQSMWEAHIAVKDQAEGGKEND